MMRRARRIFFLALLSILASIAAASALHAGEVSPAPVNPEFIEYLNDLRDGTAANRIPPKAYLAPEASGRSARMTRAAEGLPASFDIVQEGWVTPVKNQRGWGTCWDFATMEAIESNLKMRAMKKGDTGPVPELSELHLGFFAYYPESDEKPAFDQSGYDPVKENRIFDNGGTESKARAILSRGTGPVLEDDAPYPKNLISPQYYPASNEAGRDSAEKEKRDELLKAPVAFRLEESLTFADSDDIKQALMEYGGLWISFNADHAILSDDVTYLYTTQNTAGNHAVMLVGWDDTVSGDLFIDYQGTEDNPNVYGVSADVDGAWKIQNSWGTSRGEDGYYWVSYADVSISTGNGDGASSFIAMPADSYRHTYAHDPLGVAYALSADQELQTANVFTAARDEDIVCVGFDTVEEDTGYSMQIYKNIPADGHPDDGTKVFDAPLTGTADFPGYRTVKLDTPVPLDRGERFSVVMTFTADDEVLAPVEAIIEEKTSLASADRGESFFKKGTQWAEVMDEKITLTGDDADEAEEALDMLDDDDGEDIVIECTNLTIKAFTNDADRGSSDSSGCATGAFALLLVALIPIARRRR